MTLDNYIADIAPDEIAQYTYSDSSSAMNNGVVSHSDMVGNYISINQDTIV